MECGHVGRWELWTSKSSWNFLAGWNGSSSTYKEIRFPLQKNRMWSYWSDKCWSIKITRNHLLSQGRYSSIPSLSYLKLCQLPYSATTQSILCCSLSIPQKITVAYYTGIIMFSWICWERMSKNPTYFNKTYACQKMGYKPYNNSRAWHISKVSKCAIVQNR